MGKTLDATSQTQTSSANRTAQQEMGRRAFLRAAVAAGVAGAAGMAAGRALADEKEQLKIRPDAAQKVQPRALPAVQLTAVEQRKEKKRVRVEQQLRELGADIEIQWVKKDEAAATPQTRRIIQLVG